MPALAQARIDIDAPIDVVWAVMLDASRYGEWNPFVVKIDGPEVPAVGDALRLHVRWSDGSALVSPERVVRIDPPRAEGAGHTATLAYRYDAWLHYAWLVRGTRVQSLDQAEGGPTRYRSRERFGGLLAATIPLAKVQDGFERHALALKTRAESR